MTQLPAFTALRKPLLAAVQKAARAASTRSSLPILSHLHLSADAAGTLRVFGTDLELHLAAQCKAEVDTPGALTVHCGTFLSLLAAMSSEDVTLNVKENASCVVTGGGARYTLLGMPAEEFPHWPAPKVNSPTVTLPQAMLAAFASKTAFAVSSDMTRGPLTGVHIEIGPDGCAVAATDTHRLARYAPDLRCETPMQALLPERAVNEIEALMGAQGEACLTFTPNLLYVSLLGENPVELATCLIAGQFPQYQRIIPQEFTWKFTMPTAELKSAARRAAIIGKSNSERLVFSLDAQERNLSAKSHAGETAMEQLCGDYTGEPGEIAFNGKYLLEGLAVVETEQVSMEGTSALKPAVLRPVLANGDVADWQYILMPMQIIE